MPNIPAPTPPCPVCDSRRTETVPGSEIMAQCTNCQYTWVYKNALMGAPPAREEAFEAMCADAYAAAMPGERWEDENDEVKQSVRAFARAILAIHGAR